MSVLAEFNAKKYGRLTYVQSYEINLTERTKQIFVLTLQRFIMYNVIDRKIEFDIKTKKVQHITALEKGIIFDLFNQEKFKIKITDETLLLKIYEKMC